jgi:hypothetical protein
MAPASIGGTVRVGLVLTVAVIALTAATAARANPKTLVRTSAPIEAFAHDGPVIGWISGSCRGVRLQNLRTRARVTIGHATIAACDPTLPPRLALAGRRALWTQAPVGNFVHLNVMVGSMSSRRSRRVEEIVEETGEFAGFAVAGDVATLAYSLRSVEIVGDPCPDPCLYRNSGTGMRRVEDGKPVQVSGAPTALVIASSTGRLAIAPVRTEPGERPLEPSNGTVEIRRADSGELLRTISTPGPVRGVALSRRTLACVVETPTQKHVVWYSVASGALLGSLWVPKAVANELDVSAGLVVFHRHGRIRLLDTRDQTVRLLARQSSGPIGLSIEDRRVTWAVNGGGRGRVRTFVLAR